MLTQDQRSAWRRDGFLVLPGFKSAAELAAVTARADELADAFAPGAPAGGPASRFSTRDRSLIGDAALLASAEAVHAFYEEEALDDAGRLRVSPAQCINKIGHALHDLDPVFSAFSHGPALAELAADLGLQQPQVWQSMLIFKQPHIGGEVCWHQDATFLASEPHSVLALWFALEDATPDNGCLWVQPGGHRGPLRERYVNGGGRLHMLKLDNTPWPDAASAVPVPVAAGTLVCFDGLLPHYSAPNRSPQRRLAYTLHATDGRTRYAPDNWLQRSAALPVRGFD
jgi:phytanoyl-CoA hydroxylase